MNAHEKGFKFHAQSQTGAYSCLLNDRWYTFFFNNFKIILVVKKSTPIMSRPIIRQNFF